MADKKLNSGAKAFVPQSNLKASAATWRPTPSDDANSKEPAAASAPSEGTKKADPPALKNAETKKVAPPPPPAAKPVASAWGRKPLDAVKSAPSKPVEKAPEHSGFQRERSQRNNRDRDNNRDNRDNHRDNRDNNRDNRDNRDNNKEWRRQKSDNGNWSRGTKAPTKKNDDSSSGWQRGKTLPLDLLAPGDGTTESQKGVKRIRAEELLALRLSYVAPPLAWEQEDDAGEPAGPPEACRWISDTRVQDIDAAAKSSRIGGDTSQARRKKKEVETAPALEDCKPLEVNEDTRWKPKVLDKDAAPSEDDNTNDVILKKSLLILNKLSLTKFDKLSDAFIQSGIGRNEECLSGAIQLIVAKAQDEPHFAAMYAALCLKLSKTPMSFEPEGKQKVFKKMLLLECQKEFESDTETKIKKAIEGEEDEDEKDFKAAIVKKHYLGHMRFIGELYKGDLISIKIMLFCLFSLLEGEVGKKQEEGKVEGTDQNEPATVDEEKVECFTKLMTVVGYNLEQQSANLNLKFKPETSEKLGQCWTRVENMVSNKNKVQISNRIKFMIQDLIDMRKNGWTTRRQEESAKTIAQIHKEAAKEARNVKRSTSSSSLRRQHSSGDVRNIARSNSRPQMDKDGFTEVSTPSGFGRSQSLNNFSRSNSQRQMSKPQDGAKRSSSSGGSFAVFNQKSASSPRKPSQKTSNVPEKSASLPNVDEKKASEPTVNYLTPKECGDKTKNYLKEYFVGGDLDDAVLSIHELIGVGSEGSLERGAKAFEQSAMMVMEMKPSDVNKMLTVLVRCFKEKKIELESIVSGLNDPLEFLTDIAIDAPLATPNLVTIIADFVKMENGLPFSFFLNTPGWFRTDCGAASVACKVLKQAGDSIQSEANLKIISDLMTESDKEVYPSAQDLLSSV